MMKVIRYIFLSLLMFFAVGIVYVNAYSDADYNGKYCDQGGFVYKQTNSLGYCYKNGVSESDCKNMFQQQNRFRSYSNGDCYYDPVKTDFRAHFRIKSTVITKTCTPSLAYSGAKNTSCSINDVPSFTGVFKYWSLSSECGKETTFELEKPENNYYACCDHGKSGTELCVSDDDVGENSNNDDETCGSFTYDLNCGTDSNGVSVACTYTDGNSSSRRICNSSTGSGCSLSSAAASSRTDLEFAGWYSKIEKKILLKYVGCANIGDVLTAKWNIKTTASEGEDNGGSGEEETNEEPQTGACYICIGTNGQNTVAWSSDGSKPACSGITSSVDATEDECNSSVFESQTDPETGQDPEPGQVTERAACYYCSNPKKYEYKVESELSSCSSEWTKTGLCQAKCKAANNNIDDSGDDNGGNNGTGQKQADIIKYYTITYKLDGGHFIDGSTGDRKQILKSTEIIGEFKTNPIKSGYKFLYWADSNGNEFNFNSKPTKNVILTAIWGTYTDNGYYCANANDIFDPSTSLCYSVLKTYDSKEPYGFTRYTYAANTRICYAYYNDTSKPGGIYRITGKTSTATGKNNKTDGVYSGYSSDAWRESDNCLFKSACTKNSTVSNGVRTWGKYTEECTIEWKTILYKVTDSVSSSSNSSTDSKPGADSNEEDEEIPDTGDALIYAVSMLLIGAVGYSIYYFKFRKEDESTAW